jgi:hypothetical protein
MTGVINVGSKGFHSCKNLADCLIYYPIDVNTRYARVRIGGVIKTNKKITASSELTIIDMLTYDEIYRLLGKTAVVLNDKMCVVFHDVKIFHKIQLADGRKMIGHISVIADSKITTEYDSDGKIHSDFTDYDVLLGRHPTGEVFSNKYKSWHRHGQKYASESDRYIIWYTRDIRECTLCGHQLTGFNNAWYDRCYCRELLIGPIIKRIRLMFNKH